MATLVSAFCLSKRWGGHRDALSARIFAGDNKAKTQIRAVVLGNLCQTRVTTIFYIFRARTLLFMCCMYYIVQCLWGAVHVDELPSSHYSTGL